MGSIATPKNSTRLGGDPWSGSRPLVVPGDSTLEPSSITRYPMAHDVPGPSGGDMSPAKKGYAHWAASMQNEAQSGVRRSSKRPSLRRVGRRLHARTFPPPVQARNFKVPVQVPAENDAASPRALPPKLMSTSRNTGHPLANQLQNEDGCRKDGEETRLTMRVRTTGAFRGNNECLN
jgi:hypothetical protein